MDVFPGRQGRGSAPGGWLRRLLVVFLCHRAPVAKINIRFEIK